MRISKKRALAIFALISLIASFVLFQIKASMTSSTAMSVGPAAIAAPLHTVFTVDIEAENVTHLHGWQCKLKWDPQLLDVVDVTKGDLIGPGVWWNVTMNQTEGWIHVFSAETGPGVNGNGTLASAAFLGTGLGECILDLCDTKCFSSGEVSTPPYIGDVNNDSKVDIKDLFTVAKSFGASLGDPRYNPQADLNSDGIVDFVDILYVALNFGRSYPESQYAQIPREMAHEVRDGQVSIYSPVTWKWLDFPDGNPVWLTANVTVFCDYILESFDFNRSLGKISFNFTSAASGLCNASIPKLLMDGAFTVLINDTQIPSILTWNKTHTVISLAYDQGFCNVAIIGEIVTRIRSIDLITLADVTGDGEVNIMDVAAVSRRYGWKEDP